MAVGDLRHAEHHMILLGRKSAMEHLADFLLEMDRLLGDYLGLTLETVSRALS
jgi:CRP/FNR family transcriptional regulator, nitrogen fixation regulation protein